MSPLAIHMCCGVGGAGKTTTAAAVGVAAAMAGHRAVVLTIDPARRLADALGIETLGNEPTAVPLPGASGSLDALMLDGKATWDALVRDHAPSTAIADTLFANPYYQALSTRLTGGHEWMAVEKLHRLVDADRWEVLVVDTPPAQHALDFLQAPERIHRILDGQLVHAILQPRGGLLGAAARGVVDLVRRLAGERVIGDLQEFFELVAGLSEGFRNRGAAVRALLHSPACHYWLIAPADGPRAAELAAFHDALRADGLSLAGVLLNRVVPALDVDPDARDAALAALPPEHAQWLRARLADHDARASRHAQMADAVARAVGIAPWPLPEVAGGIDDVAGLAALGAALPDDARGVSPRTSPERSRTPR